MPAPDPLHLLSTLKNTLAGQGINVESLIAEFGQVRASEERTRGKQFTLREHIRGLALSLLSNQRSWGPIAKNMPRIESTFYHFDSERILAEQPNHFITALMAMRCGNRQIKSQMRSLGENIKTLNRIATDFGSVDRFVVSGNPAQIATALSNPTSNYKLKQVGFTLALEYLRNVGIRAGKPDVHMRRILGGERLAYVSEVPTEAQAYRLIEQLASAANCNPTYLDNLLWLFCARDYGNICGAQPRCSVCGLVDNCNYPNRK